MYQRSIAGRCVTVFAYRLLHWNEIMMDKRTNEWRGGKFGLVSADIHCILFTP